MCYTYLVENDILNFWVNFSFADHCSVFSKNDDFFLLLQDDVNEKINSAFCPPRIAVYNPCLEYIKSLVFPWFGKLEVVRKEGNNK